MVHEPSLKILSTNFQDKKHTIFYSKAYNNFLPQIALDTLILRSFTSKRRSFRNKKSETDENVQPNWQYLCKWADSSQKGVPLQKLDLRYETYPNVLERNTRNKLSTGSKVLRYCKAFVKVRLEP